jgi:hypothetical protein
MMIIKNSFQINDHLLQDLSHLIKGEIKHLSSGDIPIDIASSDKFYDQISIAVAGKNKHCIITIRTQFFYNENIDNEVQTLQLSFDYEGVGFPCNSPADLDKKTFEINKIKIYGEERTRIWSEIKIRDYFRKKIEMDVGDYYFSNTIVRFESSDDRYINVYAYRHMLHLTFDKNLNIEDDFYLVSDLNMEVDFSNDNVWTNVQKIKQHYEISEKEVLKFTDPEIS